MPTDTARQTVSIDAPLDDVLATIRAVETQPDWIKEILEAELLEQFEGAVDGRNVDALRDLPDLRTDLVRSRVPEGRDRLENELALRRQSVALGT